MIHADGQITQSNKTQKCIANDPSRWKVFENTQEAIIDQTPFDREEELCKNKWHPQRKGVSHIFSGIARCADYSEKLYHSQSFAIKKGKDTSINKQVQEVGICCSLVGILRFSLRCGWGVSAADGGIGCGLNHSACRYAISPQAIPRLL